jgi:hypothetical protein
MTLPFAQRALPEAGAWRVHPDPIALPRLSHDGPGLNRYDDPFAQYAVRYAAENVTGALLETMARFRPARLARCATRRSRDAGTTDGSRRRARP